MSEKRANTPERPEPTVPTRGKDPSASPLGRGADPGAAGADTSPLPSGGASIAGQRGHNRPNAQGGPEGFVDRENEDVRQTHRDAAPGPDPLPSASDP